VRSSSPIRQPVFPIRAYSCPFVDNVFETQFRLTSHSVINRVTIVATNTQFSIAVHMMAGLGQLPERHLTSTILAASVNTSPSFVRRVLSKLSKAGLVRTSTGKSGACWIAKRPEKISLLDIYRAVDAPMAFSIHCYEPCQECKVSRGIKTALEKSLTKTQNAMESSLRKITLKRIIEDLNEK
jgi:Rrf2 family protein